MYTFLCIYAYVDVVQLDKWILATTGVGWRKYLDYYYAEGTRWAREQMFAQSFRIKRGLNDSKIQMDKLVDLYLWFELIKAKRADNKINVNICIYIVIKELFIDYN